MVVDRGFFLVGGQGSGKEGTRRRHEQRERNVRLSCGCYVRRGEGCRYGFIIIRLYGYNNCVSGLLSYGNNNNSNNIAFASPGGTTATFAIVPTTAICVIYIYFYIYIYTRITII